MKPRDRILDAAMLVFRRHGFRRSSIEQAAEAAGLTRQALYHHFNSKEALFRAVIERVHENALAAEMAAADAEEKAGGGLADILIAEITGAAPADHRLVRRLAACRGIVFRTSAAGARPLSEICRALCRAGCSDDRAGLPQAAPRARRRHDAARACAMHRDGDQRRQIRAPGDAAGRRLPRRSQIMVRTLVAGAVVHRRSRVRRSPRLAKKSIRRKPGDRK